MSSPMVSRWPVLRTVQITPDDVGPNGLLSEDGARRIAADAAAAYFDLCTSVRIEDLETRSITIRRGSASPTDVVTASAGIVEVRNDQFILSVRIRPSGSDGVVADVSSVFSSGSEVTTEMRDEFIALAHGASFMH